MNTRDNLTVIVGCLFVFVSAGVVGTGGVFARRGFAAMAGAGGGA